MNDNTFELNGARYRVGTLNARQQLHVARRLIPVQAAIAEAADTLGENHTEAALLRQIGSVVAQMPDVEVDYILDVCLGVVQRLDGERWAPVQVAQRLMYQDLDMSGLLRLTFEVIRVNLSSFFSLAAVASA